MSWLQSSASDCRKFWRLSWTEKWLLAEAFAVLAGASLGLRLLGFRRCHSLLNLLAPGADEAGEAAHARRRARGQTLAKSLGIAAARIPFGATCLQQALALWWLLRLNKVESQMRIGVTKDDGQFKAHAWVELLGSALNDRQDVSLRFKPFDHAIDPSRLEPR
jgi:hypothetical protein